jgi:hypothetical protein
MLFSGDGSLECLPILMNTAADVVEVFLALQSSEPEEV